MKLFGSSGTRGVAIRDLSPAFVMDVARAAGTVWGADRAAIARDTRTTGGPLADAVASGLAAVGIDVDRLGVAPTPAACRYCEVEGVPGIVVTASHNPPEFNGLKLVGADGVELTTDALERVENRVLAESFDDADWRTVGGATRVESASRGYVDGLLRAVDRDAIADAGPVVALDPGHGAGALTSPEFYRRLGCTVRTVNATPDGRFPGRLPEPVPDELGDLRRLVRSADADLGIAHDGDADRAVFVDEAGDYVEGDASLAALADAILEPGDATVAAVNVSQRLVDVCEAVGADLELTPIGATNLITRIRELRATGRHVPIAGEGNGGVFYPDYRLTRDGAYTGAKLLELMARRDEPASELVAPYAGYHNVRLSLPYDDERELEAMLTAAESYAATADGRPDTTDGYRLDYGDAWVLVRPSGTEPKLRIYAEATDPDRARTLAEEARAALSDA